MSETGAGLAAAIRHLRAAVGVTETPGSWARGKAEQDLRALMKLFCRVDLGFALPEDEALRASSLGHLAVAKAAFERGSEDPEAKRFAETYERFDSGTAGFYELYAGAFGRAITSEMVADANAAIDPVVEHSAGRLAAGEDYATTFFDGVRRLAAARQEILMPNNRRV